MSKHTKGQYFTTNKNLKKKLHEFIRNAPSIILEPSIGQGDLVKYVMKKMPDVAFDMFEIDKNIKLLDDVNKDNVVYGDFLEQKIDKKYETIIGNPPYVKTKTGNLYVDFIAKCYHLLDDAGELIFIIPSDFLKLTNASKLIKTMLLNGTFTHIFHPHDEKLFDGAAIDIIIFRYCKDASLTNMTIYNQEEKYLHSRDGMITFSKQPIETINVIDDCFRVYVGLVSGCESIYKNEEFGNIEVINGKNKIDKYIFINDFPTGNEALNKYMLAGKTRLIGRKIRRFNENNWYEWGAPRNIGTIINNQGKQCIYIHNLTRRSEVAFKGTVQYFGGNLIMMIPKKKLNLDKCVEYFNSDAFKENFLYSSRFKIGHRHLRNHLFHISDFIQKAK